MGRTKGLHHADSSGLFYGLRERRDVLKATANGRHHRAGRLVLFRDIRKTIALAVLPMFYALAVRP
jgi:hypothetical protein